MAGKPAELMVTGAVRCNKCGAAVGGCECWDHFPVDEIPTATHSGVLTICDMRLRCHMLSNGARIFDADDLERFFGDFFGGRDGRA